MPRTPATSSISSSGSQPCCSCAMASADITADCFWSGGYLPSSRSILPRESALRIAMSGLVLPVVDAGRGGRHVAQPLLALAVRADLSGVRVLADLRRHHRAHRDVRELLVRVVHDLVRGLGAPGRAADEVPRAELPRLLPVAKRPAAAHDEEHLLLRAVAVERRGALAGRDHVVGVAQVPGAQELPHAHGVARELVALLEALELQLVDVHDAP